MCDGDDPILPEYVWRRWGHLIWNQWWHNNPRLATEHINDYILSEQGDPNARDSGEHS